MSRGALSFTVVLLGLASGTVQARSEEPPVAPSSMHHMGRDPARVILNPFTFRAPLDPYRLHQLPAFLMHSSVTTEMQRSVFAPGAGMWHTHPGPSFVYVIEGRVRLDRFEAEEGCTETPVSGAGQVYSEVGNQVHRAVVVSAEPAVVLVTRFTIPVGAAITVPAVDPGC